MELPTDQQVKSNIGCPDTTKVLISFEFGLDLILKSSVREYMCIGFTKHGAKSAVSSCFLPSQIILDPCPGGLIPRWGQPDNPF